MNYPRVPFKSSSLGPGGRPSPGHLWCQNENRSERGGAESWRQGLGHGPRRHDGTSRPSRHHGGTSHPALTRERRGNSPSAGWGIVSGCPLCVLFECHPQNDCVLGSRTSGTLNPFVRETYTSKSLRPHLYPNRLPLHTSHHDLVPLAGPGGHEAPQPDSPRGSWRTSLNPRPVTRKKGTTPSWETLPPESWGSLLHPVRGVPVRSVSSHPFNPPIESDRNFPQHQRYWVGPLL